jgi:arsenite-transporting ATPase
VALPEPTPVHEAMKLKADLKRAGIATFGWVVNRSLAASGVTEPLLAGKASKEYEPIQEVLATGDALTILPWSAFPIEQTLVVQPA